MNFSVRAVSFCLAVTTASVAMACKVAGPGTTGDAIRAAVAADQVAAVLQAVCLLLSFKVYRWSGTWPYATIVLAMLFVVHPGLYVAANPSMVTSGDCGLMTNELAAVLLLAGLSLLAFQHDAARKVMGADMQALVTEDESMLS